MVKVINTISEWKELRNGKLESDVIGFVPTMGALHEGHLSLMRQSLVDNDATVVSSFVNPTQFNDKKDFKNYPDTFDEDLAKLNDLKIDYLFYPEYEEIYHDNYRYSVTENELSKILCGAYREGHFEGVLSVVMKLLNIIKPHKAYFGEKDYQQYLLIKGMAEAFFMDVEIISCPIVREKDGLALSSRNVRLTEDERKKAALFPDLLKKSPTAGEAVDKLIEEGFKVDYIEDYKDRRFGAVHLGNVRLIDNVKR
jgi:pantoate--beta-alanine ligase